MAMTDLDVTVCAVVRRDDGRILFIREGYGQRRYGLPGGTVEPGESPDEAILREFEEETTATCRITGLLGTWYTPARHWLAVCYRCEVVDGIPRVPDTGEIAEIGWFSAEDLPTPRTVFMTYAIDDVFGIGLGLVRRIDLE